METPHLYHLLLFSSHLVKKRKFPSKIMSYHCFHFVWERYIWRTYSFWMKLVRSLRISTSDGYCSHWYLCLCLKNRRSSKNHLVHLPYPRQDYLQAIQHKIFACAVLKYIRKLWFYPSSLKQDQFYITLFRVEKFILLYNSSILLNLKPFILDLSLSIQVNIRFFFIKNENFFIYFMTVLRSLLNFPFFKLNFTHVS